MNQIASMTKYQIFVGKYLPVQTPRNKHSQRRCDLLKLINKDTAVIINILFLSVAFIIFRHDITLHKGAFTVYSI